MTAKTNPREVLDRAIRANLGAVNTVVVCRVLAYDLNNGAPKADIQPVHRHRTNRGDFIDPPTLYDVPVPPVMWGDFVIHAPLTVGDYVLAAIADRSLDEWLENGGSKVDPDDPRRFNLQDAVVLGRVDPFESGASGSSVQADALTLSKRDGSVRVIINADGSVVVDSGDIRLGSAAASVFVSLASKVDQFITFLDGVVTSWVPVAGDGGASLKAAYIAARTSLYGAPPIPIPTTGATKVKAE